MGSMWPYWAPPIERSTLIGFSNAGSQIGNVITLPLGGFLCVTAGWQYMFYIIGKFLETACIMMKLLIISQNIGVVGIIWCCLWLTLFTNSPAEHRFIGRNEQSFIINETEEVCSSFGKKKVSKFSTRKKQIC
jgi:MFS family permease